MSCEVVRTESVDFTRYWPQNRSPGPTDQIEWNAPAAPTGTRLSRCPTYVGSHDNFASVGATRAAHSIQSVGAKPRFSVRSAEQNLFSWPHKNLERKMGAPAPQTELSELPLLLTHVSNCHGCPQTNRGLVCDKHSFHQARTIQIRKPMS